MKRISISLTAVCAVSALLLLAAGCRKAGIDGTDPERQEVTASLSFAPAVETPSSVSDASTKGSLINGTGSVTKPLQDALPAGMTTETFCFYVAAWDINGTSTVRSIPAAAEGVSYDKVRYFTTQLTTGGTPRNMWNTVKPGDDTQINEYTWKSVRKTVGEVEGFHGIEKAFYAYANLPAGTSAPVVAVNGTTKLPGAMTLAYVQPAQASDQTDIIVAYYRGEGNVDGKPAGTASLLFRHPMAAVSVKLGTLKGVNKFRINSLSIEGVHSGGTLAMTPTGTASGTTLVWTPASGEGGTMTVTQSVDLDITSTTASGTELGERFIVMPQDFTYAPARIAANVTADGKTFNILWPLGSSAWEAGMDYSYTLDYNGHEGIQLWANGPYWATKNVGASKSEEAGWYFSWGNVKGYVPVDQTLYASDLYSCRWVEALNTSVELSEGFSKTNYSNQSLQGKGVTLDTDIPAEAVDGVLYDAAVAIDGTKWRIPTAAELEALFTNTDYNITTRNGALCFIFRGRGTYAGRSVIMPYCGFGVDKSLHKEGTCYCSSTISSASVGGDQGAVYMKLYYEDVPGGTDIVTAEMIDSQRMNGYVIRPVENTPYSE